MRCRTRPSTSLSRTLPSEPERSLVCMTAPHLSVHCGDLPRLHGRRASLHHRPSPSRTPQHRVQEYNTRRVQYAKHRHTGGYRSLHRWDRLDASAPLARVYHSQFARDHSSRDLSAPCLCTRKLVLGGGKVYRSHRRLSAGARDRAKASPCRWPARRSGTAAASCEHDAARQPNRLTRHPCAILGLDRDGLDPVSVGTA